MMMQILPPPGDVNETVEIVIENPANYALSSFLLELYNGATTVRAPYDSKMLDLFTVGNTIGNFTFYYYTYPNNSVQNGSPDGLALSFNGTLITGQFLSYEGSFTALGGVAAGQTSIDIGVAETNSTPVGHSLQLSGSGTQYSEFTWQPPATATAGALNNGQTLATGGVGNPVNFNALTISQTQIDLSWLQNENLNDVMIATNTTNSFGTPSGTYEVNVLIRTATVI